MSGRRRLAALIVGALIVGLFGTFVATPAWASVTGAPGKVDRLVEFTGVPQGQLEHWANFTLGELGVPEEEWGCPEPGDLTEPGEHCQYLFWSYPVAWLTVTESQAAQLDGVANVNGFRVMEPRPMHVPEIDLDNWDSGLSHPGGNGREIVPPGLERIGFDPDDVPARHVKVGVLDTGVDGSHVDLAPVAGGFDCTFGGHPDEYLIDVWGHGSHVAGTIRALANGVFVIGGNPTAQLWSGKVLSDEGWGSDASVACGIDQSLKNQLQVVNLSLGGYSQPSPCDSWDISHNIFCNAVAEGLIIVVAAGNQGWDAIWHSPANYPEVVTVSAFADYDGRSGGRAASPCGSFAADDEMPFFSNTGSLVDFAAPGVCVQSTVPGMWDDWFSGTSMATPHVTAVLSDYVGRYPQCASVAVEVVHAYSVTAMNNDAFTGDRDAFPEPIIKYGAPECDLEEAA